MNLTWRSIFLYPFFLGLISAPIVAVVGLLVGGAPVQWGGLLVASLPMLWFFKNMGSKRVARFHPSLPLQVGAGLVGAAVTVKGALALDPSASVLALLHSVLLGVVGIPMYTFGYSRLPEAGAQIQVGHALPAFTLKDVEGRDVPNTELKPAVLMFFRGNWCPLCMAQIHEIAAQYRELEQRGVKVALISGQPQAELPSSRTNSTCPFCTWWTTALWWPARWGYSTKGRFQPASPHGSARAMTRPTCPRWWSQIGVGSCC